VRAEDSERLVRTAAGTPMGELMRRYWQPALLSSEVPEIDGAPVRTRLLGEDLIAFRDTNGRIGLLDAYCPHRRAPLFFGRNEECGLRCVYHGWKFDVDGNCVDLPSEPATSPMRAQIRVKAYPTVEKGGVVWAFLGKRDQMPAPPDYEWLRAPATHRFVSKTFEECNYLQAMEGGLDTSHSSFLHNNSLGNKNLVRADGAPRIDVEVTPYGYRYISTRNVRNSAKYIRVYHYVLPAQQMRGTITEQTGERAAVPKLDGHIWVPIDDEHTHVYNWAVSYDSSVPLDPDYMESWEVHNGRGKDDIIPGTFMPIRNRRNDYMIDRQKQKTQSFTGIKGVNTQDFALQEGMGPVVDRTQENLGTSDRAIVTARRLLLEATHDCAEGRQPRGVDPATYRGVRPYDNVIAAEADWREEFASELVAKW